MGKSISLFSGYAQKENRTTNYCLLVLKLLYEQNPRFLAEALGALLGEDIADQVGVVFRQQEKRKVSIPDGLIVQKPICIYLETKNFDWFYDEQLENHLSSLEQDTVGLKVLLALGPFESGDGSRFARIQGLCKEKYRNEIIFAAVTFEDLISALQLPHLPKALVDAVSELRAYFDEEGLLPSWSQWLDVVNCAGLPEDILEGNVYMCPATGGAYSHDRCAFFGMYRNKCVERIASIRAVVDVESESLATVKWKNVDVQSTSLISEAAAIAGERRPGEFPMRVFLLGDLHETEFRKDSPGGMMGSKQYFNIASLGASDASALADVLRGRTWSDISQASLK
jgi:hypothetical protein